MLELPRLTLPERDHCTVELLADEDGGKDIDSFYAGGRGTEFEAVEPPFIRLYYPHLRRSALIVLGQEESTGDPPTPKELSWGYCQMSQLMRLPQPGDRDFDSGRLVIDVRRAMAVLGKVSPGTGNGEHTNQGQS